MLRHPKIGTLLGVVFGFVWSLIGTFGLAAAQRPAGLVIDAGLAAILVVAVVRSRRWSGSAPPVDRKLLQLSIAGEMIMIVAAFLYGNIANSPDVILPLIGLAVGLHFLPMGKAYKNRQLQLIGVLATAVALLSLAVPSTARFMVLGFGMCASIWAGVAFDMQRKAVLF